MAVQSTRGARARGNTPVVFVLLALVIGGPLAVFALPVVAVLSIGLLPAAVAFAVDTDPQKNRAISVSVMNLAGITPAVLEIFQGAMTMQHGMTIITDVYTWLVVYGAAAVGAAITLVAPPVTAVYIKVITEARIRDLKREQERLIAEWGDGVVATRSSESETSDPRKAKRKGRPRTRKSAAKS